MAVLLVGLGVMSVLMTAAMPVWTQFSQREKEAELVFRGEQYARAIGLFQRKYANAFPPNLDVLVEQKFLRKKYKDPMTADGEFRVLYQTDQPAVSSGGQTGGSGGAGAGRPAQSPAPRAQPAPGTPGATGGGIIGVVSKSSESSLRVYNGRTRFDEWAFVYLATTTQPGRPGTGPGSPSTAPAGGSPSGSSPQSQPRR